MSRTGPPSRPAAPPTRSIAAASVRFEGKLRARSDSVNTPAQLRLPTQETPKSLGSSARKSTTSRGCRKEICCSRIDCAASRPASRPNTPSKRPPAGTVSECDPATRAPKSWPPPGLRPTRFPPASTSTLRPAAWNSLSSQVRPSANVGSKARRVQGFAGSVNRLRASIRRHSRSEFIFTMWGVCYDREG